jgi:putative transposase
VSAFIDEHRERFGVGPVCRTWRVGVRLLPARHGRACQRAVEDQRLVEVIRATDAANYYAYGYRRGA